MAPGVALARSALTATALLSPRLAADAAFRIFRMPLKRRPTSPAEQAVLADAEISRISVRGRTVVTYRWGDGRRPVLLVHGWESRAAHLTRFVPGLRERGFSVVAFDAPAHGDSAGENSTVAEFRDVVRALHGTYGDFEAVIAHSVGVMATTLALRSGVRAGRLVAISGVCEFGYMVDEFCDQLALRPRVRARLRERIEREVFAGEEEIWTRFSVIHEPAGLTVAMLVVHDEQDQMVGLDQARRIVAAYEGRARLMTTSGLGHRRILADPAVVDAALAFVAVGEAGPAQTGAVAR